MEEGTDKMEEQTRWRRGTDKMEEVFDDIV
jgi:hypothetical protein